MIDLWRYARADRARMARLLVIIATVLAVLAGVIAVLAASFS